MCACKAIGRVVDLTHQGTKEKSGKVGCWSRSVAPSSQADTYIQGYLLGCQPHFDDFDLSFLCWQPNYARASANKQDLCVTPIINIVILTKYSRRPDGSSCMSQCKYERRKKTGRHIPSLVDFSSRLWGTAMPEMVIRWGGSTLLETGESHKTSPSKVAQIPPVTHAT